MEIVLTSEEEAQLSQIAALEGKDADEVARDVFARGLQSKAWMIGPPVDRIMAEEAVARMFELRKGNFLPEGVTIKDLINEGRD